MRLIRRYSAQWWFVIIGITSFLCWTSVALFWWLGHLSSSYALPAILAIIVTGDIAGVLVMESLTSSRVRFGPGEREPPPAEVVDGFGDGVEGRVRVGAEVWRARYAGSGPPPRGAGRRLRVIGREGLVLLVE